MSTVSVNPTSGNISAVPAVLPVPQTSAPAAPVAQVLPPSTPVPTASAKPQDFLQKLGGWFRNKFAPDAKVVGKDAIELAEVAEPFVDVAVPGIAGLYHTTLQLVVQAEGVAAGASGVGPQKLASVVSALEPLAIPYLKSIGVANPTIEQIEAYVNSVVAGMRIFAAQPTLAA